MDDDRPVRQTVWVNSQQVIQGQPDTPDGMFHIHVRFISHLAKKGGGASKQNLESD